jgi:probable rRNA maturation factor
MDTPGNHTPPLASDEPEPEPRLWLTLDLVIEIEHPRDFAGIEIWVAAVERALAGSSLLAEHFATPAEACVALTSDDEVRGLNARYRAKDKPTNVLSFPATPLREGMLPPGEPRHLGDIVLAAETLVAEAHDLAIPLEHHVQHLVVHGVLHLLGHDHEAEIEAEAMEALETALLADLGVPDPYCNPKFDPINE